MTLNEWNIHLDTLWAFNRLSYSCLSQLYSLNSFEIDFDDTWKKIPTKTHCQQNTTDRQPKLRVICSKMLDPFKKYCRRRWWLMCAHTHKTNNYTANANYKLLNPSLTFVKVTCKSWCLSSWCGEYRTIAHWITFVMRKSISFKCRVLFQMNATMSTDHI